ncbi:hypothetical protein [Chromobacterium vaccinii]|uniref:hypothetical protein n=1 Tax=Chromobacterium vaccinii TaxID=1108595 RepID=UPI000E15530B|nr:hypothetical protein [Chromobacterium vaccinii]SUX30342.1 Uncharacterised protein [Chromobacterium vaccinii]
MKLSFTKWPALIALLLSIPAHAATETIVLLRHGEKPAQGLGQITCQGLNRALALPQVLTSAFGAPDAIFAPDPAIQVSDSGNNYYYVRPLATIEPTAIRLGMPVNTGYGFTQTSDLAAKLLDSDYAGATIFVAWEHKKIVTLAKQIFSNLKQSANIPLGPTPTTTASTSSPSMAPAAIAPPRSPSGRRASTDKARFARDQTELEAPQTGFAAASPAGSTLRRRPASRCR